MYKRRIPFVFIAFIIFLLFTLICFDDSGVEILALVKSVDNSDVIRSSITSIGNQVLNVEILEGQYKGMEITAYNTLLGQAELDNIFMEGDKIYVALNIKDGQVVSARAVDLYRQNWELVLFILFVILLIIYALDIGIKALFSFMASLLIVWKYLLPGLLAGKNPILFSSFILILLTAIIIFSVAGFSRKGLAAFAGTIIGLFTTVVIAVFFGERMKLNGLTAPYAQTLLINNLSLDIKSIFYAAVIIGASGAAMDIAMDISASMAEIKEKKPEISGRELIQSGFNVGRAVIGTMTTTLLLAYSGGYITLLMLFLEKSSSLSRILNYKIVAAEILRTVTGSIGLVLVAPITAILAGWIFTLKR